MTEYPGDRLRVETPATSIVNAVANHSGQTASTGWTQAEGTTAATRTSNATGRPLGGWVTGGASVHVGCAGSGGMAVVVLVSPAFAVTPGQHVAFQANWGDYVTGALVPMRWAFNVIWSDAAGVIIGRSTDGVRDVPVHPKMSADGTQWNALTTYAGAKSHIAPAAAATARVEFRIIRQDGLTYGSGLPAGTLYRIAVAKLMVVVGAAEQDVIGVPWFDSAGGGWQDISGRALAVRWSRGGKVSGVTDDIEAGLATISVLGSSIDPTRNARMRPGGLIRISAAAGETMAGAWTPLFTGRIKTVEVEYGRDKGTAPSRVTITAADRIAAMRGIASPYGLGTHPTDESQNYRGAVKGLTQSLIPEFLPGAAVSAGVAPLLVTPISLTPNASMWDQLILARDSCPNAKLYVDKSGMLVASTAVTSAPAITFSGDAGATLSYLDLDLSFGSEALVNSLMIKRRNTSEPDGEKTYGPYTNPTSIAAWGTVSAEVECSAGDPPSLAANYLRKYANPKVFPRSLTFDALDPAARMAAAAWVELYTVVKVQLASASLDLAVYVVGIEHDVTPKQWRTTLHFRPLDTLAADAIANPAGGPLTGPDDVLPPQPGPLAVRHQPALSVASAAWTSLPYETQVTADQIGWDAANRWFVAPKAGRYSLNAAVTWPSTTAVGRRLLRIVVNGATATPLVQIEAAALSTTTGAHTVPVGTTLKLAAGDTVAVQAYQSSGAALNTYAVASTTFAALTYLGD